ISAKTDYGLLIMLELARYSGQIVPLSPLAKVLGVSSPYLSQVTRSLQKAGLIKSKEGAGGGYYLAMSAEKIKVLDILEALSGEIKVRCAHSSTKACPHFKECSLKSAWPLLLGDIKKSLDKRSLASLLVS
ncbi:Rrf2 family transcriptional regulator, partial [Patescibacteria group bacterium]|nr:Rrf2 family transcriptional regulator [Patescibacteria group bacterium]